MTQAEKECLKQWPDYLEMDRQDQAYVHTCMEQFSKGANWQKEQDEKLLQMIAKDDLSSLSAITIKMLHERLNIK